MRVRLQQILIILLFVTVGMLARQQFGVQQPAGDHSRTFLVQTAPGPVEAVRCFIHPLYAPELTGGVASENHTLKATVRHLLVPANSLCGRLLVAEHSTRHPAYGYPRSADYYVFSLGRILI